MGDLLRLGQVFSNLLNNAAKYTDDGGKIRVMAREAEGHVLVSVDDSGVGISPEMLRSLHGGRIEGHSEGLGKGS